MGRHHPTRHDERLPLRRRTVYVWASLGALLHTQDQNDLQQTPLPSQPLSDRLPFMYATPVRDGVPARRRAPTPSQSAKQAEEDRQRARPRVSHFSNCISGTKKARIDAEAIFLEPPYRQCQLLVLCTGPRGICRHDTGVQLWIKKCP